MSDMGEGEGEDEMSNKTRTRNKSAGTANIRNTFGSVAITATT